MGDIVTIAKVDGVAVGDKLALGADGLLVKDEAGKLAIVEALEDINVPGAEPQKSMVIRFL
jgi:hydrogenase maturation factor